VLQRPAIFEGCCDLATAAWRGLPDIVATAVERLEGVRADVEIDDGSAVTVATDERGAVLRVRTPTVEPLDRRQTGLSWRCPATSTPTARSSAAKNLSDVL